MVWSDQSRQTFGKYMVHVEWLQFLIYIVVLRSMFIELTCVVLCVTPLVRFVVRCFRAFHIFMPASTLALLAQ